MGYTLKFFESFTLLYPSILTCPYSYSILVPLLLHRFSQIPHWKDALLQDSSYNTFEFPSEAQPKCVRCYSPLPHKQSSQPSLPDGLPFQHLGPSWDIRKGTPMMLIQSSRQQTWPVLWRKGAANRIESRYVLRRSPKGSATKEFCSSYRIFECSGQCWRTRWLCWTCSIEFSVFAQGGHGFNFALGP